MFRNNYIQRKVAPDSERACFLCHRPTTSVLVNEDPDSDYFYACSVHLADRGFALQDEANRKQIEEQQQRLTEYEDLRSKWEANKSKPAKDDKKNKDDKNNKDELEKEKEIEKEAPQPLKEARIRSLYHLNRGVFNLRLQSHRQIAKQVKTQQLLATPDIFPAVPTHKPMPKKQE